MATNENAFIALHPASIAGYCGSETLQPIIAKILAELHERKLLPSRQMIALCDAHPAALAMLSYSGFGKNVCGACSPLTNAVAALLDYDRGIDCEAVAMTADPGIEVLVEAAISGGIKPRWVIREAVEKLTDPNRLFRLGFNELAEKQATKRPDAQDVRYFRWWLEERPKLVAPADLSDEYKFWAGYRIRNLGGKPDLRGVYSPRWAFHSLREGLGRIESSGRITVQANAASVHEALESLISAPAGSSLEATVQMNGECAEQIFRFAALRRGGATIVGTATNVATGDAYDLHAEREATEDVLIGSAGALSFRAAFPLGSLIGSFHTADNRPTESLLAVLYRSPGWTADYVEVADMSPEAAAAHLRCCDPKNPESLLLGPWLQARAVHFVHQA